MGYYDRDGRHVPVADGGAKPLAMDKLKKKEYAAPVGIEAAPSPELSEARPGARIRATAMPTGCRGPDLCANGSVVDLKISLADPCHRQRIDLRN